MTYLTGAVLAVGVILILEGYVILGRAQLLLTHAEHLRAALSRLVADQPSKSAPPTDGARDQPRRWYTQMREWLNEIPGDNTTPDEQPSTEPAPVKPSPHPRHRRTDTTEAPAVTEFGPAAADTRIRDIDLARDLAELEHRIWQWRAEQNGRRVA